MTETETWLADTRASLLMDPDAGRPGAILFAALPA
jgi:hypothetical protein